MVNTYIHWDKYMIRKPLLLSMLGEEVFKVKGIVGSYKSIQYYLNKD